MTAERDAERERALGFARRHGTSNCSQMMWRDVARELLATDEALREAGRRADREYDLKVRCIEIAADVERQLVARLREAEEEIERLRELALAPKEPAT